MTIPDLGQHAREDLPTKGFFAPEYVYPPLDDPDLRLDPLDEPEGELLPGLAVRRDPAPVSLHVRGDRLERFEALPLEGFLPVAEEPPCPPVPAVPPRVIERLLEQISHLEPHVGGEPLLQRPAPRKGEILTPGELRVPLPPDERFVLSGESVVFGPAHLVEGLSEVPVFSHAEILPDISRGDNTITSKSINTLRR